ncbi:hypothetical protein [Motilibacter deserti]|uniref:Uncharacterized protein n=1 Tax=Motilibacter deserti TaxID=2714956 RepID=A0ABX0GQ38_9ACTN|nr:hypothetical protein [Motilibacter deserti]NHC12578.1 hypothetical protein [Motilibacter deserti]
MAHAQDPYAEAPVVATIAARLAEDRRMTIDEHDEIMVKMFAEAQRALPPLAFHAFVACSYATRRGLATDEELDALGDDPYVVLFELERRGILQELARTVDAIPRQREP